MMQLALAICFFGRHPVQASNDNTRVASKHHLISRAIARFINDERPIGTVVSSFSLASVILVYVPSEVCWADLSTFCHICAV